METETLPPFSIEPTDSASTRWERWLRRFDNFVVARDIVTDARQKAMLLHYAGEAVFDLSEAVGVIPTKDFELMKDPLHSMMRQKVLTRFNKMPSKEYLRWQ